MTDPVPMPRKRSIVDLGPLENELVSEAKKQKHIPSLEEMGKVGAEAVNKQYEDVARQFENLGHETRNHVAKLEATIANCYKDLKKIEDAIAGVHDAGKRIELIIADAALFSQDVNDIVDAVIKKVRE